MLFANRSFSMYTLLKLIAVLLLVLPVSFVSAQEVVADDAEGAAAVVTSVASEEIDLAPEESQTVTEAPDIVISGVKSTKHANGSTELTWQTNRLSAGAVTVLYREGAGYPDQLVQQRLTSGELSTEHRYVLRGLEPGDYAVVIEVVGVDMQYDRFTGTVTVPEMTPEKSPIGFLLAWFVSLSFLIALVVLYEVIRHRSDFAKAMKELKKPQVKPATKKTTRRKAATKATTKPATKKTTKKAAPKK